jgi:hypothetical protein
VKKRRLDTRPTCFSLMRISVQKLVLFQLFIVVLSQNTRKQKLYLSFLLKNSSFRFKLERRKRSDLTMDATLGTENNPIVISGKTRSLSFRGRFVLYFSSRRSAKSPRRSRSLSFSLSLSRRCRFVLSCLLIKLYEQKTKNTMWQFEAKRCHKRMKRIPRPSLSLVRGLFSFARETSDIIIRFR